MSYFPDPGNPSRTGCQESRNSRMEVANSRNKSGFIMILPIPAAGEPLQALQGGAVGAHAL